MTPPEQSLYRYATPHECRVCGSAPAANATFRGVVGIVVIMRLLSHPGPYCRDCGLHVFRDMTSNTLMVGWWSWISAIVNPFMVLNNVIERRKVARLAPPMRDPYVVTPVTAPLNPGKPVMRRAQSWLGPALITFLVGTFAVVGIVAEDRQQVGGCVDGSEFVSCEGPHDGRIIAKVSDERDCPAESDSYLLRGRSYSKEIWCLVAE